MKASKYHEMMDNEYNNLDELKEIGKINSYKKYRILCKKSQSDFNGELRDRYTAIKIYPVNIKQENTFLIDLLGEYHINMGKGLSKKMNGMKLGF
mmetsp:Transcript_8449/g.7460  ORF Transcript_8449/g.7460 Transcript_8449/m.7460 type:complete len:95 (+) Transcript_8449:381-665(+)